MPRNTSRPAAGATLTVELLSAYLANSTVAAQDLPGLIKSTRLALTGGKFAATEPDEAASFTPAVSVRKSLGSSSHILSMIDGRPYRTLRRHLAAHGLTPESYRTRYDLPVDYPMVAPDYAAHRRALALQAGLGSKRRPATEQDEDTSRMDARPTTAPGDAEVPSSAKAEVAADAIVSVSACAAITEDVNDASAASAAPATEQVPDDETAATVTPARPEPAAIASTPAIADEAPAAEQADPIDTPGVERSENSHQKVRQRRSKLGLFSKSSIEDEKDKSLPDTAPASPAPAEAPPVQSDRAAPATEVSSARLILMEAIARRKVVTALYNGTVIKLSPHQLFQRNGDLFITAVNASKKWRVDEEKRLGQFKLAGLKDVELLDETITPLPSFDNALPRADDSLLLSI